MGLTSLFNYLRRLRSRARFKWHYWRKARRERAALAVDLGELNPWTIPEAEQQERENAESRVLRVSQRRGVMDYKGAP